MIELNEDRLGSFEIVEEIGRGGMGIVYHAISPEGDDVALKICATDDEFALKRFKREVRAIQKIKHENVMPVLFADLDNIPPYYTMPLAYTSVNDIVGDLSKDHDKALNVFLQICYGVQAAHLSGECHRDIKPQNALVLSNGRIVVSDFGLVKFLERDSTLLTKTQMMVGTELYMAPEQFLPGGSRDANTLTDIYQLGKTLYQLYTGQYPAVMSSENIPTNLWFIIQKATKQNPSERFADVAELIDATNDYIASLDPSANPQELFLIELKNVNDQLAVGMYTKSSVDKMISILMSESVVGDVFLSLIDKIPDVIINLYSKEFVDQQLPLIEKYYTVLKDTVRQKDFEYAEYVSKRMQIVYLATADYELKAIALMSILIAAVRLNRYRAMSVFNKILVSVENESEACYIAKKLDENLCDYKTIYSQIGKDQLHFQIQRIWDKADGLHSAEVK